MNYEREYAEKITAECSAPRTNQVGGVKRDIPMEPVSEKVRCIAELGDVANGIAARVFVNLFGRANEECCSCDTERAPECMDDVLNRHRREMKRLVNMLEEIACRLGV